MEGIFEWNVNEDEPLNRTSKHTIFFSSRFSNCYPADANASVVEDKFLHGQWLVLLFAEYSGSDVRAVKMAALASELINDFRVAVQPFWEYEQNSKWSSDLKNEYGSPLWLVLKDGRLLGKFIGLRSPADVVEQTLAIAAKNMLLHESQQTPKSE